MKLHEKGKTSNSEWFGVEHYRIFHEMDLFRYVNMERLQMLYPDIFRNPKPKSIIPSHPSLHTHDESTQNHINKI